MLRAPRKAVKRPAARKPALPDKTSLARIPVHKPGGAFDLGYGKLARLYTNGILEILERI
jgi:hypothetical protein